MESFVQHCERRNECTFAVIAWHLFSLVFTEAMHTDGKLFGGNNVACTRCTSVQLRFPLIKTSFYYMYAYTTNGCSRLDVVHRIEYAIICGALCHKRMQKAKLAYLHVRVHGVCQHNWKMIILIVFALRKRCIISFGAQKDPQHIQWRPSEWLCTLC